MSIIGTIGKFLSPVRVHTHPIPRCENGRHDPECRGPEVICRVMFKGDKRFCVCVHLKV